MDIQHISNLLNRHLRDLGKRVSEEYPDTSFPTLYHALASKMTFEATQQQALDDACHDFAQTETWPENLTARQSRHIQERIVKATNFLMHMGELPGANPPVIQFDSGVPNAQVLEFLLIDHWHLSGELQWWGESFRQAWSSDPLK